MTCVFVFVFFFLSFLFFFSAFMVYIHIFYNMGGVSRVQNWEHVTCAFNGRKNRVY